MTWRRGDTVVTWAKGAVVVRWADGAVLVDAPVGVEVPDALDAIVLTSSRREVLGGLMAAFDRADDGRRAPLTVFSPWADERAAALADVWVRHFAPARQVEVDSLRPGTWDVGATTITAVELPAVERSGGAVVPTSAVGVRLQTPDALVAVAPPCRVGTTLERLVSGVDLAIVWVRDATDLARLSALGPHVVAVSATLGPAEVA